MRSPLLITSLLVACAPAPSLSDAGDAATVHDAGTPDAGPPAPDATCTTNGCLRSAQHLADVSLAELRTLVPAEVRLDNGYSVWNVELVTDGRTQRATITLPFQTSPPDGGFHLGVNAHGTTGVGAPCALAGTVAGAGLAGTFGARGFIGVAPDFPGLGTPGAHPYLVSRVEGRAVLDAARAGLQLARWRSVPHSSRVAIAGLSQGGHAVLAAAAEHSGYAPQLDLRAVAAAAPASVFEEQWRFGIGFDGPHLSYHALLVWAWTRHYGSTAPSPWAPTLAANIDALMNQRCVYSPTGAPSLGAALGTQASTIFDATFLAEYRSGTWSTHAAFRDWFALNRVKPYAQTAPLLVLQGDADDTVPEPHTRAMVGELRAGGVQVDYRVATDAGHLDLAVHFLATPQQRTEEALGWLAEQLSR